MSTIKADPDGSPTEQARAAHGWRIAARDETRCDQCCSADWERSRTGLWCRRWSFATRVTATCALAAPPMDTAQGMLLRACAEIEVIPTGLRTDSEQTSLNAMYQQLKCDAAAPREETTT